LRYQPALDGLRGVAVAAVVAYHVDRRWLPGGYLGVDIFFVLSGFLITTLLLDERRATHRIDLRGFWARRARRLFPALALVLVAVAAYARWWAPTDSLHRLRWDGLATAFYVANWRFVASHQSYFEQLAGPSPLRHMWSLGVEEQWYLVWPLLVFGVGSAVVAVRRRAARRMARVGSYLLVPSFPTGGALGLMAAGALLLAGCSAVLMAVLVPISGDTTRAYFGTDTHAQSLLVGAALAFWLQWRPLGASDPDDPAAVGRRVAERRAALWRDAGFVGLAVGVVLLAVANDQRRWMYRGGFLLAALAWAGVTAACLRPVDGPLRRLFAAPPLVGLGRISYGVYLWHWPVIVALTPARTGLRGLALEAAWVGATLALALASWVLVERPIRYGTWRRRSWWQPRRLVPAGAVVVVALLVVSTLGATAPPSKAAVAAGQTPNRNHAPVRAEAHPAVDPTAAWLSPPSGAFSPPPVPYDRPVRITTLGDSVGFALAFFAPPITGATMDTDAIPGCGVVPAPLVIGGVVRPPHKDCATWLTTWRKAAAKHPDVALIFIGGFEVLDPVVGGKVLPVGSGRWLQYLVGQLNAGIDVLTFGSTTRVALMTVPCMTNQSFVFDIPSSERMDPNRIAAINQVIRWVAASRPGRVALIDYAKFACPDGQFRTTVDGVVLRPDGMHVDKTSGPVAWNWLAPIVLAAARRPSL